MVGCWVGVRLAHFYLLCNNVHSYLSIYLVEVRVSWPGHPRLSKIKKNKKNICLYMCMYACLHVWANIWNITSSLVEFIQMKRFNRATYGLLVPTCISTNIGSI